MTIMHSIFQVYVKCTYRKISAAHHSVSVKVGFAKLIPFSQFSITCSKLKGLKLLCFDAYENTAYTFVYAL